MASATETALPENLELEFISLLIDLYHDCPELWKLKSKDYFNRNKKSVVLDKIAGALKVLKPDFTVKQLIAKINVLRKKLEFKAAEGEKVSGTSTNDIPEPSLWYYNDLYFIKDQLEIAVTETSEFDRLSTKYEEPVTNCDLYAFVVNYNTLKDEVVYKLEI